MPRNQTRWQIGITEGGNQVLIVKSSSDDANVWPDWEPQNKSRRQGSTLDARRMSESPKGLWEARCWSYHQMDWIITSMGGAPDVVMKQNPVETA